LSALQQSKIGQYLMLSASSDAKKLLIAENHSPNTWTTLFVILFF